MLVRTQVTCVVPVLLRHSWIRLGRGWCSGCSIRRLACDCTSCGWIYRETHLVLPRCERRHMVVTCLQA